MIKITVAEEAVKAGELFAVPRKTYEEFLFWQKTVKSRKIYKPTEVEKKDLQQARKEFKQGEYTTLKRLKDELGIGD